MEVDLCSPAGIFGHHYYVQNKLGTYRTVITAATYKLQRSSTSNLNIQYLFQQSLKSVLETHSPLSYGFVQTDPQSSPSFIRLKEIKFSDILQFHDINIDQDSLAKYNGDSIGEKLDSVLTENISNEHADIWTEADIKPLWRCAVYNYLDQNSASAKTAETAASRFDIMFIFNHAIGDGLSGLVFHQTLQVSLNKALSQPISESLYSYIVPNNIKPPRKIEDLMKINFDSSPPSNPAKITNDIEPWTFANPTLPTPETYKTRTRLLLIPRVNLISTLQYCRTNRISLTGLLHGLILTSLARNIPAAQGFRATTPFSVRPFITPQPPTPELACHVALISSDIPKTLIYQIRNTRSGSVEEAEIVHEIGRRFRDEVREELESAALGNVALVRDIAKNLANPTITYEEHVLAKFNKKRSETYELSNVMEFVPLKEVEEGSGDGTGDILELKKLVFTQCGMVTGAAVGCSVVSVKGGPLVAGFTWMDGVVEIELVERVIGDVKGVLMGL